MTINYITSDVEFKKSTLIDGELVTVNCTTRHASGTIGNTWAIDFSNATHDEILALATQSVVIKQQIAVRKCDRTDLESFQSMEIDVHEMVNRIVVRVKKPATPDSLATDAKKMTDEQRQELIAALESQMNEE